MKEGTGGDPFGDDTEVDRSDDTESTESGDADTEAVSVRDGRELASETSEAESIDDGGRDSDGLPWAVERRSVKSDREMVQFYLRNFVQERESEFQREVESETGYDTYLTDVREAAYLVAMDYPEEVARLLDDWGCEYD